MPLAALLIPLIPQALNGLLSIVDAIRSHADTPEALKTQLDDIAARLQATIDAVANVELPNPPTD